MKTLNSTQQSSTEKCLSTSASEHDESLSELYSEGVKELIKYRKLFNLHHDTVFLAIDILKSFIKKGGQLTSETMILVAISCLMLACKYNEIYPPKSSEISEAFEYFEDDELIFSMEGEVLMQCQFEIPTQNNLMSLLFQKIGNDKNTTEQSLKIIYKNISSPQFLNASNMKIMETLFSTAEKDGPKVLKRSWKTEKGSCLKMRTKVGFLIENKRSGTVLCNRDLNILIN